MSPCIRTSAVFTKKLEGFLFATKELETGAIATRQHLRIMPISKSNSERNQVENEKGVEARLKLFCTTVFRVNIIGKQNVLDSFLNCKAIHLLITASKQARKRANTP